MLKRLLWAVASIAIVCAIAPHARAAQILAYDKFSTTAASGTLGPYPVNSAAGCTLTVNSGGGATLTIQGSADAVSTSLGGTYANNNNFGTNGVITAPSSNTTYSGSISQYPVGFGIPFTGNTGTLSGTLTCTDVASGSGGGSIGGSVSVSSMPPVAISSLPPVSVNCITNCTPAPIQTLGPLASPSPLPSPGFPFGLPEYGVTYFFNGSAWVPVTSTAPLPVAQITPTPSPTWSPSIASTSSITATASTTTLIYSNSTGHTMYLHFAAGLTTGTNSGALIELEIGTKTTTDCDTGPQLWMPSAISLPNSAGGESVMWGAGTGSANAGPMINYPLPIPNGSEACVVSQGTTVNFKAYAILAPTDTVY